MENPQYELGKVIGEFTATVHALAKKIDELHESVVTGHNDHEERIRVLENALQEMRGAWKATVAMSAVVGSVVGGLASIFVKFVLDKLA